MQSIDKEKIRPIYSELQGYLSQAPLAEKSGYLYRSLLGDQFNTTIDELNNLTGKNYDKFKVNVVRDESGTHVRTSEYRSQLNGLIMRLYAEYFKDEASPFGGSPNMIVSQTQLQSQSAQIQMVLDFQSLIDKKLYSAKLEEKEKTFLEKIKSALPSIKSAVELIKLIISVAKSLGMDINQVANIFQ